MSKENPYIPKPWRGPVAQLSGKIRFGWLGGFFLPWAVAAVFLGAVLSWILEGCGQSPVAGWGAGLGVAVVGILFSLERASGKTSSLLSVVSRLDEGWHLDQMLVRAYAGEGEWPEVPVDPSPSPLRVRWERCFFPLVLCVGMVCMSMMIPYPEPTPGTSSSRVAPSEWKALEELAQQLEEEEIVEPETVDSVQKEIDRLRAMPEQEWYAPAGLEATDRLQERVETQTLRLAEGVQQTADLLQIVDLQGSRLSLEQQSALQQEMERLVEGLGDRDFSLPADQLDALRRVDLRQLEQISPEQMQALQEQLMAQGQALEEALMAAGVLGPEGLAGQWGTEGGGPAELGIGDQETIGNPQTPVLLEIKESDAVQMGDLMKLKEIEHQESTPDPTQAGGAVRTTGGSGAATWERDLSPREQAVLNQFFSSNPADNPSSSTP